MLDPLQNRNQKLKIKKKSYWNTFNLTHIYSFFTLFLLIYQNEIHSQNKIIDLSTLTWEFKAEEEKEWNPAKIPGNIHLDLFNNHLIPDPFYGKNEKELSWIETKNWEYKTTFLCNESQFNTNNITLEFEGLDTYSEVWINDQKVAQTDNMFLNYKLNIKPFIKKGKNKLYVKFYAAKNQAQLKSKNSQYPLPGEERVFVRKAQYQFGWDWAPKLTSCGIWKPARIHFENETKISELQSIQKELKKEKAEIGLRIKLNNYSPSATYEVELNLTGLEFQYELKKRIQLSDSIFSIPIKIENPKIWWCNERGEQNLYTCQINLLKEGELIEKKEIKIGLREIELQKVNDGFGNSFTFSLNKEKIFAKGANLVPLDVYLPRVKKEEYESLIQLAISSHMNMIRVWGGGIYENEEFYDLCDKYGILVWQDFMFACAMYPGDSAFIKNVEEEIKQQVIRLRNHPSLALWCGNNENIEGWYNWGWQKQFGYSAEDSLKIINDYNYLFEKRIPEILRDLDSGRIYHPSSPALGWGRKESYLKEDVHYWGVWWGMEPFENYEKKTGRFVSEYGFQSLPDYSQLKKFIPENELNLNSESVKSHQKHPTGFETIIAYMKSYYPVPDNIEDFAYVSQLLQAQAMKTAIESHRKKMPYCMGSLLWQLNDCWPVISWSIIDHYGKPKAAYYQTKKSFKKTILHSALKKDSIQIYAISDEQTLNSGKLKIQLFSPKGTMIYEKNISVTIPANNSTIIATLSTTQIKEFNHQLILKTSLSSNENTLDETIFYFQKPMEMNLKPSKIKLKKVNEESLQLECVDYLSKDIFLSSENLEFEENFFDLIPGETKIIKIKNKKEKPWNEKLIQVKTLNQVVYNK